MSKETSDSYWLICPYCGHKHSDPYEFFGKDECTTVECGNCEREFDARQYISITYYGSPKE